MEREQAIDAFALSNMLQHAVLHTTAAPFSKDGCSLYTSCRLNAISVAAIVLNMYTFSRVVQDVDSSASSDACTHILFCH